MPKYLLPLLFLLIAGPLFAAAVTADQQTADLPSPEPDTDMVAQDLTPDSLNGPGKQCIRHAQPVELATIQATCTADCWNGTRKTCMGSSCSAVDSNCPAQRGYCWSSSTGYQFCPICPEDPPCEGSGTYCESHDDCSYPDVCTCAEGFCSDNECICPE